MDARVFTARTHSASPHPPAACSVVFSFPAPPRRIAPDQRFSRAALAQLPSGEVMQQSKTFNPPSFCGRNLRVGISHHCSRRRSSQDINRG